MTAMIVAAILVGSLGLVGFVYYVRSGQMDDIEDIKYQIFRDQQVKK